MTPLQLPSPDDRWSWSIQRMKLVGCERVVARRAGTTLIFAERDDGSWRVTKMRGGRITAERKFASMPRHLHQLLKGRAP